MTDVAVDEIVILCDATKPRDRGGAGTRRRWRVAVTVNGNPKPEMILRDPFGEADYGECLDRYVTETANVLWGVKRNLACTVNGLPDLHRRVKAYGNALLEGLGLRDDQVLKSLKFGSKMCTIHIREKELYEGSGALSIHRLHWELLESADLPDALLKEGYKIKVVREINIVQKLPIEAKEQLEEVQKDWSRSFKVLLVLARKFIQPKDKKPPLADRADPHLAQWTLMDIQDKLVHSIGPHRLVLDIVRPGSMRELREHLKRRKQQGFHFNLVHFDLHGGFVKEENGDGICRPVLYFAKDANTENFLDGQSLEDSRAEAIASILGDYRIENVVLNACESASERNGRHANMCRLFIRYNVRFALGMWPEVNVLLVEDFLKAFYNSLLVDNVSFETAVHNARLTLRENTNRWPADSTYLDDFLCVQYTRYPRHQPEPRYRLPRLNFSRLSHLAPPPRGEAARTICSRLSQNRPRKQVQPLPQPFIKLDLLALDLENHLRTRKMIYAYDVPSRQVEMRNRIRGMAQIWLRTNLINKVFFYNAEDFERTAAGRYKDIFNDVRRSSLPTPQPHKGSGYTLHIIEGVDAVVDGINPTAEKMATAKKNLKTFFNELAWARTYLIILTIRGESWWDKQKWTGNKTGIVWFHGKPYFRSVQHSGPQPSY